MERARETDFCGLITTGEFQSYSQLMQALEDLASHSRTTKFWLDNLIKLAVLIMRLYIRAERESDWPLHLFATKMMMPYFFASGHFFKTLNFIYFTTITHGYKLATR